MVNSLYNTIDPFSQESLNLIFKVSPGRPNLLNSRETSTVEFKESFNLISIFKYAKTMAAFANTEGGYIIFGIKDRPHKLIGIKEEDFSVDSARITESINDVFSPEIRWDMNIHEFQGKTFGLLYVYPSENKPVVARKNAGDVKEAEIYYRYRGRSEKIKYPELIVIFDERRVRDEQRWMKHIEKIAHVGVDNAAVFDVNTGEVSGSSGSFVIDQSLLPKLKFIKEGQFVEREGLPTLKLVGDLQVSDKVIISQPRKILTTRTRGIRSDDIITEFLKEYDVDNPIEYIKQICWESSPNLPVYYYIRQSNKTLNNIIFMLEEVKSRSPSHGKLIERLHSGKSYLLPISNTTSESTRRKMECRSSLISKTLNLSTILHEQQELKIKYILQAIRMLTKEEIDNKYIRSLLYSIYETYFTRRTGDISTEIRMAICHLDVVLYKDEIILKQ